MIKNSLTYRQKEAFDFVSNFIDTTGGVAPTCQEIAKGLKTTASNAQRLTEELVARGWINKKPKAQRTLSINVDQSS